MPTVWYDTIYYHRAQAYELIGNREGAIADCEEVLRIHSLDLMAEAQAALERLGGE